MNAVRINPADNVAVALSTLEAGQNADLGTEVIELGDRIAAGHKLALNHIRTGDAVIKYGYPIGVASCDIAAGSHVHTHNLKTGLGGLLDYTYSPVSTPDVRREPGTFMGYRRENGSVGVRNELWIIPTVGCVNDVAKSLEARAQSYAGGSLDGVYAFTHPYGCSQLGGDHENTMRALCGLIKHPNAAGVLVVGLGCENNTLDGMREYLGEYDGNRVKFMCCQQAGDELEAGLKLIGELAGYARRFTREPVPSSELVIGLKCGGSDGFSGITANPLAGMFSDRLISEGGSAILTEVPEMFGAETILMNRCADSRVFAQTVELINGFKSYYIANGQNVYENPSPGNKEGGITTLEEKALGCTQKCGCAAVTGVLSYGQPVCGKGLHLLNAPGNDLVASSALAASGAHIVLFTTGRGTPFGCPVPTVKISSNTALSKNKSGWIDFDAGALLSGISPQKLTGDLYDYVLALASGTVKTSNERRGAREFTIFKTGVTL